jgi:hypothetical protein
LSILDVKITKWHAENANVFSEYQITQPLIEFLNKGLMTLSFFLVSVFKDTEEAVAV